MTPTTMPTNRPTKGMQEASGGLPIRDHQGVGAQPNPVHGLDDDD